MSDDSALENTDTAELLETIDIEETLQPENVRELLDQLHLESVLGGFGAAVGSGVGAILGRKLATALDATAESSDEATDEEDDESADDPEPGEDAETDGKPETREGLEDLSYRELQSLAAETDVKGNISKERMVEQLAAEFGLENE